MLDKIAIANEALAEVPADAISDFDEKSLEAEWAARRYGPALGFLLEQHDWKFPVVRKTLAVVENDRPSEWLYAYRVPDNCAAELRLVSADALALPASVPLLAGQRLGPTLAYNFPLHWLAYQYLLAGTIIYSNLEDAVLEYIASDPSEALFSAMFTRAFSLELACRLVMPIKKDSKRQRELITMAEVARDRAICDAINRDPTERSYGHFESEDALAREGLYGFGFSSGYWMTR